MRRCVTCGAKKLTRGEVNHELRVGRRRFAVAVPAMACGACGEAYVDGPALAHAELEIASQVARAGVASGDAFRFMRKALGLKAADVAAMLDVRAETVSRWETGRGPVDRGAFVALAAMVADALDGRSTVRDVLHALGFRGAAAAG